MKLYWIRHLPIESTGCYTGQSDVEAILPSHAAEIDLPENALWFSSPLKRAQTTATWLAAPPLLKSDDALKEQHFGTWEGRFYDEIWMEVEHQYDWSAPELIQPPEGESFADVCRRVDRWLDELLEEHHNQEIVIVTHAGVIRAALRHAKKISVADALSQQVDCASVTHVTYGAERAAVHYVNVPIALGAESR